jgi:ferredoxin
VKVVADHAVCQGHARCQDLCPEVFSTDDQLGKVVILMDAIPEHFHQNVRLAARNCPEGALTVVDE